MTSASRVAVLVLIFLGVASQSAPAQSEGRYVLEERTSFQQRQAPSLETSDFVGRGALNREYGNTIALHVGRASLTSVRPSIVRRADTSSANLLAPIGLGLGVGAAGLLVGSVVGVGLVYLSDCDSFGCGLGYPLLGGMVGETVGLSLGVYWGTERPASYLRVLLGGALGTAVAMALARWTQSPDANLVAPVLQLAFTIPIARSGR